MEMLQQWSSSPWFYVILAWSLAWKAVALWHAARNRQIVWYVALLVINTVGLLEILYLVVFRRDANQSET
jgi:predicted PolB exonuclease-like 3'-5' exonuclease